MISESKVDQNSQEMDLQKQRYSHMMQLLCMCMVICSLLFSCIMIVINSLVDVIVFELFALVIYLFLFFIFRRGNLRIGFYGLVYLISLNGLVGNTLIGWRSGIYVILFSIVPILFYNPLLKKIEKYILSILYVVLLITTSVLGFLVVPGIQFDALQLQIMNSSNVLMVGLIMAGISYMDFRYANNISAKLIDLNQQLSYQASRDSLTNLFNRRTMNQFIQAESVRSSRSGKPYGLIMADVDDFKNVNDEHGHAAGDMVLKEISALLSATLRKQDLISRWGGEEFLILLPETGYEGVQVASEKVRDIVCRCSYLYQGRSIQVTMCIGGVVCQGDEDWDESIKHADRALYYGKTHGKNLAVFSKDQQYCVLGDLGDTVG